MAAKTAQATRTLSVSEAARRLGIRMDTVYLLLQAGRMEAGKVDGRWRIPVDAVEARRREVEAWRAKRK